MLQLKCIHRQCAFCFHEQVNNACMTHTHEDGDTYLITDGTGDSSSTALKTGGM